LPRSTTLCEEDPLSEASSIGDYMPWDPPPWWECSMVGAPEEPPRGVEESQATHTQPDPRARPTLISYDNAATPAAAVFVSSTASLRAEEAERWRQGAPVCPTSPPRHSQRRHPVVPASRPERRDSSKKLSALLEVIMQLLCLLAIYWGPPIVAECGMYSLCKVCH